MSEFFLNNFTNNADIEKYLTESCSECANNQLFLNLFIKSRLDEQIQEQLTQYEIGYWEFFPLLTHVVTTLGFQVMKPVMSNLLMSVVPSVNNIVNHTRPVIYLTVQHLYNAFGFSDTILQ